MAIPVLSSIAGIFKKNTEPDDYPDLPISTWSVLENYLKSYRDPSYDLSSKAYYTMRHNDVILQPMTKLAQKIGSMEVEVVGVGKRRDKLQEYCDQAIGWSDILEWMAWAVVEGVRFSWSNAYLDDDLGYWIPDFRGCGRVKWKAAGDGYSPWHWTGWEDNRILKLEEYASTGVGPEVESAKAKEYDRNQVVVFRPGAGNNPEGETEHILQMYLLAEAAQLLDKSMRAYAERYGLPREVYKAMVDLLRPDEMTTTMQQHAAKMKLSRGRRRMATTSQDALEIIEPNNNTWQFLTEYRKILEARAHKLITGEMQSSGGSQESGDRGGHDLADKQLNAKAIYVGKKIMDAFTADWLPWIEKLNDHDLPRLKSTEPKPYLALRPPKEKQRPTVAEFIQVYDRGLKFWTDDAYEIMGVRRPPDVPDIIDINETLPNSGVPGSGSNVNRPDGQPSNEGGAEQRGDRKQDDSGSIGPDVTRKQDPKEDQRNIDKEGDE